MKLQREKSKIKSRINYKYYKDVAVNVIIYSIIIYVSVRLWIWVIGLIIKMINAV